MERNHGVYQDRLVKEMRLQAIATIEEANRFLADRYLPRINERFARAAAEPEDAHVGLLDATALPAIFCFEEPRVVSRDFVVQYHRRLLQILPQKQGRPQPGGRVLVQRWLDGSLHVLWKDRPLLFKEIVRQQTTEKEAPEGISA